MGSLRAAALLRGHGCSGSSAATRLAQVLAVGHSGDIVGYSSHIREYSVDRRCAPSCCTEETPVRRPQASSGSQLGRRPPGLRIWRQHEHDQLYRRGYSGGGGAGGGEGDSTSDAGASAADSPRDAANQPSSEEIKNCLQALRRLRTPWTFSSVETSSEKDSPAREGGEGEGEELKQKPKQKQKQHPLQELFFQWLSSLLSPAWSTMMRLVDKDFDEEEFTEGVADAFCMVNSLISAGDWKTLEPMLSPGLLERVKQTHKKFEDAGLRFDVIVQDIGHVGMAHVMWQKLATMRVARPGLIALLDAGEASWPEVPEGKERMYLMAGVRFRSEERWVVSRVSDGTTVQEEVITEQQNFWVFGRGPVVDSLMALKEGSVKDRLPINYDFEAYPWHVLSTTAD